MRAKKMGNKKRFQVFQRDEFTCQYCGQKPPTVVLEVDHIIAKSKGGKDDIDNLITSCFECNRGKSNIDLKAVPQKIKENLENIKERRKQLNEFYKYQQEKELVVDMQIADLDYYWSELWDNKFSLNTRGKASVKMFLKSFSVDEIKDAMFLSTRIDNISDAFRYMCGILHNRLRERNEN